MHGGNEGGVQLGIDGLDWVQELGSGGFGSVHRARDHAHGRDVAVKLLHASADERSRIRFDRERRLMGSVSSHPNIVTIYTSGFNDFGTPYLVMELVTGGTLGQRIEAGPLTAQDARAIGVTLGEALCVAHDAGVLHLDIKPDNVLIGARGEPQIADFGIASSLSDIAHRQTISISPSFSPLEVLNNVGVDGRADVYSLAATLYNVTTGRLPYWDHGQGLVDMLRRMRDEPIPRASDFGVPEPLSALLVSAMAVDPQDRPPSMTHFVDQLRALELGPTPYRTGPAPVTVPVAPSAADAALRPGLVAEPAIEPWPSEAPAATPWRPEPATDPGVESRSRTALAIGAAVASVAAMVAAVVLVGGSGNGDVASDGDITPVVEQITSTPTDPVAEPTETPAIEPTPAPEPSPIAASPSAPSAAPDPLPPLPRPPVLGTAWSTDVDPATGRPARPLPVLPPDARQGCFSFDLPIARAGVDYEFRWYRNGSESPAETTELVSGAGNRFWGCHAVDAEVQILEVEFLFDDQIVFQEGVSVGGAPGPVLLRVINESDRPICALFLAHDDARFWGLNELDQPIGPGGSRLVPAVPQPMNYRVLDCGGAVIVQDEDNPLDLETGAELVVR